MADRAFRYHRVSGKKQSEDDKYSLPEQEDMTAAYCKDHGYEVVGTCREIHTGHELDERPEMTRLREMIRKRQIDVMVMIVLDRLARNQNHQEVVLYEAEKYGIRVELTQEKYEDTPVGRHLRSLAGFIAEIERDRIKERTWRGVQGRIKSGKIMPSNKPVYGYSFSDAAKTRFVVNPETAPIAIRIFEEAASGKPLRRIAIDLTKDGILCPTDQVRKDKGLPPTGAPWQKSTIWHILQHPAYYGQHSAFRWETIKRKEFNERGEPVTKIDKVEHEVSDGRRISLPDAAPALITRELAEAVRSRMEQNKAEAARHNKHPEATLLRGGFVKCGQCGNNMVVAHTSEREGHKILYRCYRPQDRLYGVTTCKGTGIVADKLDSDIWGNVLDVIKRPEIIREAMERGSESTGFAATIEGYEHQIAGLDQQQAQVSKAIGLMDPGDDLGPLVAQFKLLGKQKTKAQAELDTLKSQQAEHDAYQQRMRDVEAWCHVAAQHDFTYEDKRIALYAFQVEVTVWGVERKPRWIAKIGPVIRDADGRDCVPSVKPEGHAAQVLEYVRQRAQA